MALLCSARGGWWGGAEWGRGRPKVGGGRGGDREGAGMDHEKERREVGGRLHLPEAGSGVFLAAARDPGGTWWGGAALGCGRRRR